MAQPEVEVNLSSVEMPPRKGRLETYLWDYSDEVSSELARIFHNPEKPVNHFGVLIPVAAHQDAKLILPAMAEYAAQKDAQPFTIFLFLNHPSGHEEEAKGSVLNVQTAKTTFPQLDIRTVSLEYDGKIPIGQIRKDLWDAVTRVVLADGLYDFPDGEFIGINHDIDTDKISPHYMRNIQRHYRTLQADLESADLTAEVLPSRYTQVKHSYPFATHPNLARAILWYDFSVRQSWRQGLYEEGLAIPLSFYAQKGGFRPKAVTHETRPLAPHGESGIPGTGMDTSPRRYITRLGEFGFKGVWTVDSFTNTDPCRDPDNLSPDITHEQLEDIIFEDLDRHFDEFVFGIPAEAWEGIVNKLVLTRLSDSTEHKLTETILREAVIAKLIPKLRLAKRVLEVVVASPTLASFVDEDLLNKHTDGFVQALNKRIDEDLGLFGPKE